MKRSAKETFAVSNEDRPRNRAGQRAPPTEGKFPAECRAVRSPTEGRRGAPRGNAKGTEKHTKSTRTKTEHRSFPTRSTQKAPRGNAKGTEQRQNTEVFPREAHKKHAKNHRFLTVFSPFTRHFEAFYGVFAKAVTYPHHPQTVDL